MDWLTASHTFGNSIFDYFSAFNYYFPCCGAACNVIIFVEWHACKGLNLSSWLPLWNEQWTSPITFMVVRPSAWWTDWVAGPIGRRMALANECLTRLAVAPVSSVSLMDSCQKNTFSWGDWVMHMRSFIYDHNEYANGAICIYANQDGIIHKIRNKETSNKEPKGKWNESILYKYAN